MVLPLIERCSLDYMQCTYVDCICSFRFVGRFMNRRERLEILGDKMKRFNNVYIKNFGDEMSEDEMKDMFEPFGKLISVKVNLTASVV